MVSDRTPPCAARGRVTSAACRPPPDIGHLDHVAGDEGDRTDRGRLMGGGPDRSGGQGAGGRGGDVAGEQSQHGQAGDRGGQISTIHANGLPVPRPPWKAPAMAGSRHGGNPPNRWNLRHSAPRSVYVPETRARRPGRTASGVTSVTSAGAPPAVDPNKLLRSPDYLRLLGLAAAIGLPISAVAYGFLTLVHFLQEWVFDDLPHGLGFSDVPAWWPLPVLGLAGVVVGLVIRYLPGGGGHSPAHGFQTGGCRIPATCPESSPPPWSGSASASCSARRPRSSPWAAGWRCWLSAAAGPTARTQVVAMVAVDRQLRRRRHPARLAHRRRVLPHGGHRDRRAGHGHGARSRPALGRDRRADIHRPGQLDRPGHAVAQRPRSAAGPGPTSVSSAGPWRSARSARCVGTSIRRLGPGAGAGRRQHVMLVTPTSAWSSAALAIIFAQMTGHSTAGRALLRADRSSGRCSPRARPTRSARCCCCWCARGSPTVSRSAASAADPSSRPCSSAPRSASRCPTCPACR